MLKTAIWTLITIVVIELVVIVTYRLPKGNEEKSTLRQYFDYGRSTEGKIIRLVGRDESEVPPLLKAGWFREKQLKNNRTAGGKSKPRILVYGMSFSNRIAAELEQLVGDGAEIQQFAGPSASLNHSYAYIEKHRPFSRGDIVILGILASSLSKINSLTHMTANFEQPAAHFYPRYRLEGSNRLERYEIEIMSLKEFSNTLQNESRWRKVKFDLANNDAYYDELIFGKNLFDHSVFARLLKRAWAQRSLNKTNKLFHDERGFTNTEGTIDVSRALIKSFAQGIRQDGAFPYVILFNDRGFDDHLYRVMVPVLDSESIPFFSTHGRFPANDHSNFIADGHFKPTIDREISAIVLKDIAEFFSR